MALGGSTYLKSTTMLEQLLEEINFQRTKEMRQLMKDDCGFVVLQGTTYWTDLFVRHFLFQEEQSIDCDDLLFFVRKRHVKGSSRYLPKYEVYASPSRRKMDTKGEGEEMTYPHICFMVDNFDEVFCDIVVRDGEMVCVELVARGRGCAAQAVIFLGSIRYDILTRVYDSRQTSLSTKVAQRMSFGLLGGKTAARCEFVRMKGPSGKGHAEMAVSRPHATGLDTPSSEPGLPATDMWDSDWDDDPEEMFMYRHQRRLSDPSANINNFVRGGWRTRDSRDKSRSENEGLDSLVNGIAEVEAGDLRDGRRADVSSPACLGAVSRRVAAQRSASADASQPPRRRTPDGTAVYYWCDLPRRHAELDDGAYNPLWATRGFTQTFHLWKEGKRQQSTPLNAYLTYVTLPWWTIAKDILDHREEPVLTF
ncbi:uncharacterized protein LOC110375207 isoform X3 [Helicoverpa armigera]|uniref:uncharacterized protein LOC110375207 isoform X3 n=1 Tax=Helicoverpa armigera TaxID=29058 RepID=UPI000B38283A|nr:uncharacterized protein LOC110375207 isoform X4 [Helicoverpa armigera]XP_047023554.1 uncharacterized protein LOC124632665 isoform X4 [Helicoverpa zea]